MAKKDKAANPTEEVVSAVDDKIEVPEAPVPAPRRRVVCTSPNPSSCIDGFTFVTIDVQGESVCVSEHIADDAKYERFLRIPGFSPSMLDETLHARAIEDAIQETKRAAPAGSPNSQVAEIRRQLSEQQEANQAVSKRLADCERRNRQLAQDNAQLKQRVQQLESMGVRRSAPEPTMEASL